MGARAQWYRLDHRLTLQERSGEKIGHETAARNVVLGYFCSNQSVQYVLASLRVAPLYIPKKNRIFRRLEASVHLISDKGEIYTRGVW